MQPPKPVLRGDTNLDNAVSVDDAQLTLRAYTNRIAGNPTGLSSEQILAADINGDGSVSVDDAQLILRYYTEKVVAGMDVTWDMLLKTPAAAVTTTSAVTTTAAVTAARTTTTVHTTTAAPVTTTAVHTTVPVTNAPVMHTEPAVTAEPAPVYAQVGSLQISPYPLIVRRNEDITLRVIGLPNTEYDIDVYYSSGASRAKGLENRVTDSSGFVSWTWQIGGKTRIGSSCYIILKGGGVRTRIDFTVVN